MPCEVRLMRNWFSTSRFVLMPRVEDKNFTRTKVMTRFEPHFPFQMSWRIYDNCFDITSQAARHRERFTWFATAIKLNFYSESVYDYCCLGGGWMGHFVNYLSRIMSRLFMECAEEDFVDCYCWSLWIHNQFTELVWQYFIFAKVDNDMINSVRSNKTQLNFSWFGE